MSLDDGLKNNNMDINILKSTEEESILIDDKIISFNIKKVPHTQSENLIPLNFNVKNKEGVMIAGINAFLYGWKILYIDVLFVDEEYRYQKIGSVLLKKIEQYAKAEGAKLVHLDTFDFQAKDFYLKQGYEIFGVLDDCPENHKRYYLKKKLL